jgi:hypothetical protein
MDENSPNFEQEMNRIARKWAVHIVDRFKRQIEKKNISLTDDLLNSFEYKIFESGSGNVGVNISYQSHGKFIDMKNLYFNKMPTIDKIEAWVKKKGLQNFDYIPGYSASWKPSAGSDTDARRIAWGIARSRQMNGLLPQGKERQWRAPELKKGITYLNHLLAEELAKTASNNIVTAFQN